MAKKKPVVVAITEGKPHPKYKPNQVWRASHKPTPQSPTTYIGERYVSPYSAKRGACRSLGGYVKRRFNFDHETYKTIGYFMQDGREIQFVVKPKTTKSK